MAEAYKTLAQLKPSATTLTDFYTVPASTSTVTSTIIITNQSATATSFRIAVAVAGAADNTKQYLYYDFPINGNDSIVFPLGMTLATTDVVRVYATLATLSFNLFGTEIT